MPLEQTITIVNSSGKIISNGKNLLSVFKEAKGAYQDKKAQLKSDKFLNRAQTFHDSRSLHGSRNFHDNHDYHDNRSLHRGTEYSYGRNNAEYENFDDPIYDYHDDRRSHRRFSHDVRSETSSTRRSVRRSRSTHSKRHPHGDRDETRSRAAPLTMNNLKTFSEVSSQPASRAPKTYRSPYAETLPRDMTVSKVDVAHADIRNFAGRSVPRPPPTALTRRRSFSEVGGNRHSALQPRVGAHKEIDMDLAYGSIPPDLAERYDLDPVYNEQDKEKKAKTLVRKVEMLLDEAHCLQHGATATISHLQRNPDTAASVALTLAELSKVVSKMSPAVLGMLKGGSPAVFALLASPQFLIGTSIVVGVTVVMFGGWKIVKRVKEQQAAREALAFEGVPPDRPAPMRTQSEFSNGMDEALILDDELSTIETWRRGIAPFGENESADMELITPEAERAHRQRHGGDDDTKSRRSTRTTKTSKTSKTKHGDREVPERKSSRQATTESVAGSERSRRSTSSKKRRDKTEVKAIEDGRSRRGDDEETELQLRPRAQRQGSNMLKALFKNKKEKSSTTELVHA